MSIADVLTAEYLNSGRRACWAPYLQQEFDRPYMRRLRGYLADEESEYQVFPRPECIFEALEETTLEEVKVVVMGQDPYDEPGQAHGLAFSTINGTRPQSLAKVLAEVGRNMNGPMAGSRNCLTPWARQGVLLLNRALTVRECESGKHLGKGWECFTDQIIATINDQREHVVFLLWGDPAQEVRYLIDADRHKVLCSQHPADRTGQGERLRGSEHFSKANRYLEEHGAEPINWLDVCDRPPPDEQDAVPNLTANDAADEARWDRAFANSTPQLDQLAAEAAQERCSGQTVELDPSQL